ncbi:MAG TPA: hypothetical protein DCF42_07885 [Lachnospiraceae bacterium]|nr:hypothetical protein [Lachnospiraceae bacterium]
MMSKWFHSAWQTGRRSRTWIRSMGIVLAVILCFTMLYAVPAYALSNSAVIVLDTNGGTGGGKVTITEEKKVAAPLPAAQQDGYVFNGWWTKNGEKWGSILKPGDREPSSSTTYFARWTEISDTTAKTNTYFYGKAADDSSGSVTYNYGEIGTVNKGFTYNYGTIGTVPAAADSGTYNYGTIENYGSAKGSWGLSNNYGVIKNNSGNVKDNYGIIESSSGTVSSNDGTVKNNTGTVKETEEGSVTYNEGGTISEARNGTIYNYSGTVTQYWASGSPKVYNFAGGTFVYNSSSGGATIYDLGGKTSGKPGRYDKTLSCYKVDLGNGLVKSYDGDFIQAKDGSVFLPEGGTGTLTPAEGVDQLYMTGGDLTKNNDGTYTVSNVKKDTAVSDVPSYSISYDLDGGTLADGDSNPAVYTSKDTVTLKNPQDKKNSEYTEYLFDGWTGTGLDAPSKEVTIPAGSTGDRSYKATWKPNPDLITITFKYDEDSRGIVKKYDKSQAGSAFGSLLKDAKLDSYVDRTGYDFAGWHTEAKGGEKIDSTTARPSGDTTFYAHWKIRTVTIQLDGNGGTDGGSFTGKYKETIGVIPMSTRSGYIFNGWWTKDKKGNWGSVLSARDGFPAQNTTYYARWTKKTADNTISFINGTSGFDGFYDAADENRGNVSDNYGEIGLVTEGGTVGNNYGSIAIYKGGSISNNYGLIEKNKGSLNYNYNLLTENSGEVDYNEGSLEENRGKLHNNRADVTNNKGTVDYNYGVLRVNDETGGVDANHGEIQFNTGTVNKNYGKVRNFGGTIKQGGKDAETTEFYKVLPGSRVEKVTYEKGFTEFKNAGWLEEKKGIGIIRVTLTSDALEEAFTVKADGCSIVKNEDGSYTLRNAAKDVTISAEPAAYRISYDLGGGKGVNKTSYTFDDEAFSLNIPIRKGYTFTGWSGTDLTGEDNMEVTVPKNSHGNRSYQAHWKPVTYKISYKLKGGTIKGVNPASYTVETAGFTLRNPKREGYVFTGWTGTGLMGSAKTVTVKRGSTGNRIYQASWKRPAMTAKLTASGNTAQKLTWSKAGARKYEVYQVLCSGSKYKKIAETKKTSLTVKNLKKGTQYKYYVIALDSSGKRIAKSMVVHSIVGNSAGRLTNAKSVRVTAPKKKIRAGQTLRLNVTAKGVKSGRRLLWKGHTSEYRYLVLSTEYAGTVSNAVKVYKNGTVKGLSKGKVKVYVFAANGVSAYITLEVK